MDIVIAGTADAVMMVEGGGNEIDEEDFLGAVEFAHAEIRKIIAAIDELAKKAGKPKREYPVVKVDQRSRALGAQELRERRRQGDARRRQAESVKRPLQS